MNSSQIRYTKECALLDDLESYLSEKHSIILSIEKIKKTLSLYDEIERAYQR